MDTHFRKASFVVPFANAEEEQWFRRIILTALGWDRYDEEMRKAAHDVEHVGEFFFHLENKGGKLTNDYGFHVAEGDYSVWISHKADFEPTEAALLLWAYLRKFNKKECIVFEWSNDCTRETPGAYGGGACCVTAEDYTLTGTREVLKKLTEGKEVLNEED